MKTNEAKPVLANLEFKPMLLKEFEQVLSCKDFINAIRQLQSIVDQMENEAQFYNFDIRSIKYYEYKRVDFNLELICLAGSGENKNSFLRLKDMYCRLRLDFGELRYELRRLRCKYPEYKPCKKQTIYLECISKYVIKHIFYLS